MKKTIAFLFVILQFMACCAQNSGNRVNSFEYSTRNGMRKNSNLTYSVKINNDGLTEIQYGKKTLITPGTRVIDDLTAVVEKYNMDKYSGTYSPKDEVKDGSSWSLSISKENGNTNHASGYMAGPDNWNSAIREAIYAIKSVFPSDSSLVGFRYEYYDKNGSKVYTLNSNQNFTSVYFRNYASREGAFFSCLQKEDIDKLKEVIYKYNFRSYTQTRLNKEDRAKSRWLIKAEYSDYSVDEIVQYFDDENPDEVCTKLSEEMDAFFKEIQDRISNMKNKGEHTITTYGPDGKPQQEIRYDGDGRVLNGMNYGDPRETF